MNVCKATRHFEDWLGHRTDIVKRDVKLKHQNMANAPFPFFRATFYRWAQWWPIICPNLARAPVVLAVGDLHVENFGTWRDSEGRLIWGVNDFDEAFPMAYTNDLVRLAASAMLARDVQHFQLDAADACEAILTGYKEALKAGGSPFVLAEKHPHLREMAFSVLSEPSEFWEKLLQRTESVTELPHGAMKAIRSSLPKNARPDYRVVLKPKGLGSLGQQRFLALADWYGSYIAREAKSLRPSACNWALLCRDSDRIYCEAIRAGAAHCPDPLLAFRKRWLVRRLGPYCRRIDMENLRKHRNVLQLLPAMGKETANIHLGTKKAARCALNDLKKRPRHWL